MISGTLLLIGAFSALIYFIFLRKPKWENAPPGPSGLPLVGNLFQLDKLQHKSYCKWAKEFGPIYKISLANTNMVVVSDYKFVKELLSDTANTGKMDMRLFDPILDGHLHGILHAEGEHWEELRRFTLRQLRDFGFGKNSMEESIMVEVQELIELLKNNGTKPVVNIKERLLLAVINSLWFMCTGTRHNQNDEKLLAMTEKTNKAVESMIEGGGLALFAPWLAKTFPVWTGYDKLKRQLATLANYFRVPVAEHKKTIADDFDRDFVDVFLKEIKKTSAPSSAFYGKLGEDNLVTILFELYFAGTDTTATVLSWMILYLSKFPEIQRKFQAEIDAVVGKSRSCSVTDKPNMPYTEAMIAETLRFSSILAQFQHKATKDQEFKGYMIPKGTVITPNLYHIHHDPTIWEDPEAFRPERFLSLDGKTFKKHDALIAFSTGRRQCLGESLARNSLFLFSTNMFQRFSVQFDKNGPDHGYETKVAFLLTPKDFNVILKDRFE